MSLSPASLGRFDPSVEISLGGSPASALADGVDLGAQWQPSRDGLDPCALECPQVCALAARSTGVRRFDRCASRDSQCCDPSRQRISPHRSAPGVARVRSGSSAKQGPVADCALAGAGDGGGLTALCGVFSLQRQLGCNSLDGAPRCSSPPFATWHSPPTAVGQYS